MQRVRLSRARGDMQVFDLTITEADGSTRDTRIARVGSEDGSRIAFKDLRPPAGIAAHTGRWRFEETLGGSRVHLDHQLAVPPARRQFDTIVDSALYHCLGQAERRSYVSGLRQCCKPGGHLHILCFSDTRPGQSAAPRYVPESELRAVLADGWEITGLRLVGYVTSFTRQDIEKAPAEYGGALEDFQFDALDRFVAPAWLVTAVRH